MFDWIKRKKLLKKEDSLLKHLEKSHLQDMKIRRMELTNLELKLHPISFRKDLEMIKYTKEEQDALRVLAKKFGFNMAKDLQDGDTIVLNLQLVVRNGENVTPMSDRLVDAIVGDGDYKR